MCPGNAGAEDLIDSIIQTWKIWGKIYFAFSHGCLPYALLLMHTWLYHWEALFAAFYVPVPVAYVPIPVVVYWQIFQF